MIAGHNLYFVEIVRGRDSVIPTSEARGDDTQNRSDPIGSDDLEGPNPEILVAINHAPVT